MRGLMDVGLPRQHGRPPGAGESRMGIMQKSQIQSRGRSALLSAAALLVAVLGAAQCSFSPDLATGLLRCGTGATCPEKYTCVTSNNNQSFCCAAGDSRPECTGAAPDGGTPIDTATAGTDLPPAIDTRSPTELTPRLLVTGQVLLADFNNACTRANPASTPDRWCAFSRTSGTELLVVNVTAAAKGPPQTCDGSNPACLSLTKAHFTTTNPKLVGTRPSFYGDLLIFYAEATLDPAQPDFYRGGVFAWYPGWTEARRLTGPNGARCHSQSWVGAPAALCVDRTPEGATQVRAGLVPPGNQLLPLFQTLTPTENFFAYLNRGGDRFIYGVGPDPSSPLALFMVPIADVLDPSKRVALAPQVKTLAVSPDGSAVYYVAEEGRPGGPVFAVDTATGAKRTDIAANAEEIEPLTDHLGNDHGVVTFEERGGGLATTKVFFDRVAPQALPLGRIAGAFVSPDRRYSLTWAVEAVVGTRTRHDLKLTDNSTATPCVLQGEPRAINALSPVFSPDSHFVFWQEPGLTAMDDAGWVAIANGCKGKRAFTGQLLFSAP